MVAYDWLRIYFSQGTSLPADVTTSSSLDTLAQSVPVVALALIVLVVLWKHHKEVREEHKEVVKKYHDRELKTLDTLKEVSNGLKSLATEMGNFSHSIERDFTELSRKIDEHKNNGN